ncbi:MAG: CoA-binding protein, partial [Microvirga sp.]
MSTYRLDKLFNPRSIAVVGASPRPGSLGLTFLRNLIAGGFEGELFPVNPHHVEVEGRPCFASLSGLPEAPDLIVVAVPPERVLGVIEEAGSVGVSAAIVATAGMGYGPNSLGDQVRLAARAHGLRVVGPNCIGVLAPRAKMNASFAAHSVRPGDLALVSQSGALAAGLVEWAAQRQVGFSA